MVSSREYWQYARECARWAAQSKDQEDQNLFINMEGLDQHCLG
jgi:hypothetical protein